MKKIGQSASARPIFSFTNAVTGSGDGLVGVSTGVGAMDHYARPQPRASPLHFGLPHASRDNRAAVSSRLPLNQSAAAPTNERIPGAQPFLNIL